MEKFILALDQGTSSSRAIIFDRTGGIRALAQKEFKQYYPQPGWVEHDALEIWSTQAGVAAQAITRAGLKKDQIESIGITNQRETTIVWDKSTGRPVCPAIVWQDRRTAEYCDELKRQGLSETFRQKTGLIIDAYFSGTKLKWILEHVAGASSRAKSGQLAFGTVDCWLLWNLTGGRVHATDVSNASRTMLFNIHSLEWDEDLLSILGIPAALLPEVRPSSGLLARTDPSVFSVDAPVGGMAGDQQAALFGQMCTSPGLVKNTYGTGCFLVMNTGQQAVPSHNQLLTTIAWSIGGITTYALEGSIFIAGAVVQWLRDGLKLIPSASDSESLAAGVPDNGGVFMVPAFTGLGAPHWDPYARGTILGLTRGSTGEHLARAALESIAFQTMDVLKAMESDSGISIRELRVDGGATSNNLLMQFQADILGVPVVRPRVTETTAFGAACLAGLATGYWENLDSIRQIWQKDRMFSPSMDAHEADKLKKGWQRAIRAARSWSADSPTPS